MDQTADRKRPQHHDPGVVRRHDESRRGQTPDGAGHAQALPHRGGERLRAYGPSHRPHGGHRRRDRVLDHLPAPCQQKRGHGGRRRPAAGQPWIVGAGR